MAWQAAWKKLAIWGLFLLALYVARDFFFVAFMTFMFSYLVLTVVERGMHQLSRNRERAWLRKLLTATVFAGALFTLLVLGSLIAPRLLEQGQRLVGWLSNTSPESEVARLLANYVGPYEFKRTYGSPDDSRYQQGLKEFLKDGDRYAQKYLEFSNLEAWLESGFTRGFMDSQRARIRQLRAQEGTSSKDFEQWFLTEKAPQLKNKAQQRVVTTAPTDFLDSLVRSAATDQPVELLQQVRHNPSILAMLRKQWIEAPPHHDLASPSSTAYQEQFRGFFEQRKRTNPNLMPYTFEQYVELQNARRQGRHAFAEAWDKVKPSGLESEASHRADFEATTGHELFENWWATSEIAKFIRSQVETSGSGGSDRMERIIAAFLNIPIELGTAILLSFFICFDFPKLKRGVRQLRDTWLRDAFDEIAPALCRLSHLVGRSMQAQGLIALCNATMVFAALAVLGVEHELVLSGAVFVLCLVPTVGAVCAWILVAAVALLQPDGGLALALKASGAFLLVVLAESFVLGPRILGRMMELHPVMIVATLPVAQYFFGVWGLILATPVVVYVVQVLILGNELAGMRVSETPVEQKVPISSESVPTASVVGGHQIIPPPHMKTFPSSPAPASRT